MGDVILSGSATQIAAELSRALSSATWAILAREGTNPLLLGVLAESIQNLVPHRSLIDGLIGSTTLEGTWNSRFMSNFMGQYQKTTQQVLLQKAWGQKLVIYVTALAAAVPQITVRTMLREHMGDYLNLHHVAEVPENIYRACVHSPTLQLLQQDIADNIERCTIAFSAVVTGRSKVASSRELAVIVKCFAEAQNKGLTHWVRVKNLVGAEALCATLAVAFNADVWVGFVHAASRSPINTRSSVVSAETHSADATAVSMISTSIRFEYDNSGEVVIGLCETGGRPRNYVVEHISSDTRSPGRYRMLGGQMLSIAKMGLKMEGEFPWIVKGAVAAFDMRDIAAEMTQELSTFQDRDCTTVSGDLMGRWMEAFVAETGGDVNEDIKKMPILLAHAATSGFNRELFAAKVQTLVDFDATKWMKLWNGRGRTCFRDILLVTLCKILFGQNYTGLEFDLNAVDLFDFSLGLRHLIPQIFRLLASFKLPVFHNYTFSICCSVVQCGGYALMPRVIAEDVISGPGSSPFIMVAGHLAKDGVAVTGFYYDEEYSEDAIDDTRPQARIPSDASDSSNIDYVYERAEYGYKFWSIEAGYRLRLEALIETMIFMHYVDDNYAYTADSTTWQRAAPHHMIRRQTPPIKIIYLSFENAAGRRLALSRASGAHNSAVVHFGQDYARALGYAERSKCNVIIL